MEGKILKHIAGLKKVNHREGGRPWSKLGRDIRALFAPNLPIQIHCSALPLKSKGAIGSTRFPRYWITLGKEVIFDYPSEFWALEDHEPFDWERKYWKNAAGTVAGSYPYEKHGVSEISELIRDYINRPNEKLLEPFENDRWGLTEILKASDRRIGKQRLKEMQTDNPVAKKIIGIRLGKKNDEPEEEKH